MILDAFTLENVNSQVNAAAEWGTPCVSCSDHVWDCDDYANVKRLHLIELGADPKDFAIWFVRYPGDTGPGYAGHYVLQYRGAVLDNRFKSVTSRRALERQNYRFEHEFKPEPVQPERPDQMITVQERTAILYAWILKGRP